MNLPDTVLNRLRARGERLTIPRRLVIDALCNRKGHMTINDIQQYIGEHHSGHDLQDPTVYRILQWLKDLRLVSQTDIGSAGIVYELIGDLPHHHLICLDCGAVIELEDSLFVGLRDKLREKFGFDVRIEHMAIYGRCDYCSGQNGEE